MKRCGITRERTEMKSVVVACVFGVAVMFGLFGVLQDKNSVEGMDHSASNARDGPLNSGNSRSQKVLEVLPAGVLSVPAALEYGNPEQQRDSSRDRGCQGDEARCVVYHATDEQEPATTTQRSDLPQFLAKPHALFAGFAKAGYAIFSKEPNIRAQHKKQISCVEYSFLRLNLGSSSPLPGIEGKQFPSKSLTESIGFFDESDEDWERRKAVHEAQMRRQITAAVYDENAGPLFFHDNWEPSWHCAFMQRLGNKGDGGKWVCDPYKLAGSADCVVLSIGSNNQFDFEEAILALNPRCEIHTFDHTIANPSNKPPAVHFHPFGLGAQDTPPVLTLESALAKTGVVGGRMIEMIKIDCEGCEYEVWEAIAALPARQVLMEVHWGM